MPRPLKRLILGSLGLGVLLFLIYILGPRASFEKVDNQPITLAQDINSIEKYLAERESAIAQLKPNIQAQIIWADSAGQKTEYSIVYLHGFSASHAEGYPMHVNIADSLDANIFLSRLPEHGIEDKNVMKDLTPADMIRSAKEAVAIGKLIGEKVILMACSTGGTLGIYVAAGDPSISGLVMLSPNIEVAHPASKLLTGPWGRQIVRKMMGEHRTPPAQDTKFKPYWTLTYHSNGLIAMQALLDQTMQEDIFDDIRCPVYTGYFYKDEEVRDHVISIDAIKEFKKKLDVDPDNIEFEAFSEGDHVLGCIYKNENWPEVQSEVLHFIKSKIINRY